ncbi:hypothetical protein [Georgenia sp. SUBG003]
MWLSTARSGRPCGRVFDRIVDLDDVADAYRAMDARESLKVAVTP